MQQLKFVLICKRFWPLSGEQELLAAAFAHQLCRMDIQVDIVTWRMIRQWPDCFQFGSCRVIRLPQGHKSTWPAMAMGQTSRNRWHRRLHRWISLEGTNYDRGIVFEFENDSLAPTTIAGAAGLPIISRIAQKSTAGLSRNSIRDMLALKDCPVAFVTPDQSLMMDPWVSESGPLQGLKYIPDGYPQASDSVVDQATARNMLKRIHPIFQLEDHALLAVCGADLTFESGVFSLVRAWRQVSADQPDARLWLIGTGRNTPELFQRICDLELQNSVLLTGNFDDVGDVLAAADAYIMPGSSDFSGWYSNVAGQIGITMIHHRDCPAMASESNSANRILYDDGARPIDLVLHRWASARRSGEKARPVSVSRPTGPDLMEEMVTRYLEVLEQAATRC